MVFCFRWGKTGIFTDEVPYQVEKTTTIKDGFE